jgi:catechol 2,3-dioxygenase-like lactoylglutathione lyase family enzyme
MLELGTTVLVVDDLERALAFWKGALGFVEREPPSDDWAILDPADGRGGSIALDRRPAPKSYPPRMHLDLYADDQDAEIERLLSLGASRVDWDGYPSDADYVVLEDTEGNRFCVIAASEWFS